MMLHVIKLLKDEDDKKYGDLYLINLQNGLEKPIVYAYSPKRDCYISRDWSSVQFLYFLDEKGRKYDRFLKRIRKEPDTKVSKQSE